MASYQTLSNVALGLFSTHLAVFIIYGIVYAVKKRKEQSENCKSTNCKEKRRDTNDF